MRKRQNWKKIKSLLIFSLIQGFLVIILMHSWGEKLFPNLKLNFTLGVYNQIVECTLPQLVYMENGKENIAWEDITQTVLPSYAYHSRQLWYEAGNGEEFSKLAAAEEENNQARREQLAAKENEESTQEKASIQGEVSTQEAFTQEISTQETTAQEKVTNKEEESISEGAPSTEMQEEIVESQEVEVAGNPSSTPLGLVKKAEVNRTKLQDFDYLRQNFYQIDSSTTADSSLLNIEKLLEKDVSITDKGEEPVILIYHTHSQEGYEGPRKGIYLLQWLEWEII